MADEIKQKISLEGEKEYSAALKEANRNLKTLRSELKAESAELGNNASAQAKNEVKARSLRKQIAEQEKVVNTLKSALKEAKERYGDNNEEVAKWEQKLNGARYTLATMNNALEQSEAALKGQGDALKDSAGSYEDAAGAASDYADAVDAAGATADAVNFQSIMTAADNLTGKLQNAMKFIMDLGKAAWEWMSDSGEWADTLTTDATKWGVDRQTLQGWRYASRFVDTEVETIARSFTKLTNRSDATNKKLKEIGIVADKGAKGQDLFWDVIDAMNRMDEAARENTAMDIFGKSYQELLPLINAGRDAWEGYVKQAEESGYVLDDDQIDKLGKFDDANQKLEASFEAMQHTIAAELAPAFTAVSEAMSGLIDSFTEWAKTEEGQNTLHDLGDALKGLVESFTGDKDFTGLVNGAADAVKALTKALEWIKDNHKLVEGGFVGVATAVAGLKVSQTFLSALQLIKGIKWASLPKGTPTTPTTTTPTTPTTGGGVIPPAMKVLGPAVAFVGTLFGDLFRESDQERGNASEIQDLEAYNDFVNGNRSGNLFDTSADALKASREAHAAEEEAAIQAWWDAQAAMNENPTLQSMTAHREAYEQMQELLGSRFEAVMESINQNIGDLDVRDLHLEDVPSNWYSDILDAVDWENAAGALTSDDVSGFAALPGDIEEAVANGIATGTSGMSISMDGVTVGRVVAPYVSQEIASQMFP